MPHRYPAHNRLPLQAGAAGQVSPQINALSAIIFVVVLLVLIIMNIADIRKHRRVKGGERA